MDRESPLNVAIATLGCKVNQTDAASLQAELLAKGHQMVPWRKPADVYIIHTCTVTQRADYQSRQLIRRVIAKNPKAQIIVTGCYAQVSPETLQAIPGVDCVVGVSEREKIPGILARKEMQKEGKVFSSAIDDCRRFEETALPSFPNRTRAYLKIQDGCNSFCSYCIVPYARGRNRSLPFERALEKAQKLSSTGFQEIILTGVHLGTYGEDLNPPHSLLDLLEALEKEERTFRLRLSSIEPKEFNPLLIDFLARSEKICPHLHIPLQSGDDRILHRMNRRYSSADFRDLVNTLAQSIPGLAIGVDIIGGFPGEDQEAFANSLALIETLPIAYLHVFPYSRRQGTLASGFPEQVSSQLIKSRCQVLRELGEEKRQAFYRSSLGKKVKVLIESKKEKESGMMKGYSRNYLPVLIQGGDELINRELEVVIQEVREKSVLGEKV